MLSGAKLSPAHTILQRELRNNEGPKPTTPTLCPAIGAPRTDRQSKLDSTTSQVSKSSRNPENPCKVLDVDTTDKLAVTLSSPPDLQFSNSTDQLFN